MIIDSKEMIDKEWKGVSEENKAFLDRAIKRINERIAEVTKVNNGILMSDLDKIVNEELGLDLTNYDVNFMDVYIDYSESEDY